MIKYFSPGRINLIGEHIDYNGGQVFPCAIDLGVSAEIKVNDSNIITFNSKDVDTDTVISVDYTLEFKKTLTWADYLIGVLDVFRKHGYENKVGFDLTISSTLPHGAGLSSSACIEVLMGTILNDLNDFKIDDTKIAVFAMEAENNFVGVNCGIMDQFIIANGKKDCALLLNTHTLEFDYHSVDMQNNSVLILNSNKKRGLVESAYNERRSQCSEALKIIQKHFNVENICDISSSMLDSIREDFDDVVYKRALHAVTEQERVKQAIVEINNKDIKAFANIITKTHYSLKDDFEVSCDELDYIVETSILEGALGARMVGAGFGGCAIAIVENSNIENFKQNLSKKYYEKYNLNCDIYDVNIVDKCKRQGE